MKIKITDLLPMFEKGYVIMDSSECWYWESKKPVMTQYGWRASNTEEEEVCLSVCFDIAPADDWTKSLIAVKGDGK